MKNKIIALSIVGIFLFGTGLSFQASKINAGDQLSSFQLSGDRKYQNNEYLHPDSLFSPEYKPGELIVKFLDKVSFSESTGGFILTGIESVDKLNIEFGVNSVEKLLEYDTVSSLSNIYKLTYSMDIDALSVTKKYTEDPNVKYAEPNYILSLLDTPNDPLFDQQWGLNQYNDCDIDAPEAWEIETGDPDVVIAVLDSGVDYNHIDLADNIWINEDEIPNNWRDDDNNGYIDDVRGWDFAGHDKSPMDEVGHGTHCAGIISAVTNNGIGVASIARGCKIMSVRVGNMVLFVWNLLAGIAYAANNGADVISMSLGTTENLEVLKDILDDAYDKGCVLVAGAGNDDTNSEFYPAGYDNVIAVAATDQDDNKACFSNYGIWVDVAAPGLNILSLRAKDTDMYGDKIHIVDQYYYIADGTSFACPFISAVVGLLISNNPNLNQKEIKTIISNAVDELNTPKYIGGRINAHKALLAEPAIAILDIVPDWDKGVEGIVDISGTVSGEGFQYYIVEYGRGKSPLSWIELANSTYPIEGVLISIDTTGFYEGIYTIQLRVICNSGTIYKDHVWILIDNEDNTVYVDDDNINGPWYGTADYPCRFINNGIDNCGYDDDVFVHNGTYPAGLILSNDKKNNLIGENKSSTFIDGNGFEAYGLTIEQDRIRIEGFTIRNCEWPAVFILGFYNCILDNNFKNNMCGLITSLGGHIIYHNNFINNDINAMDIIGIEGQNNWYDPISKEGNYWDDYQWKHPFAKPDSNRPWIWDTPYNIPNKGTDEYPLVNAYNSTINNHISQSNSKTPFLLGLLERFPNAFPLLRLLLLRI
jgi:hypothetical protein